MHPPYKLAIYFISGLFLYNLPVYQVSDVMKLSLRQLEIFCAIAHTGSTTAAAEAISLSQSATSAALNELENVLATKLFDRVGKRLLLNDEGRFLLPRARQALDAALQIEVQFHAAGGLLETTLTVGASSTIGNYVLPPLLAAFRKNAPARVNVAIGNSASIAAMVANFDVDVGLIEGPCHQPELVVTPWLEDELVIICAPDHPLATSKQPCIEDLRIAPWILREPGSGTREEVEHALLPHLHSMNRAMEIGSSEAIKRTVAAGLGVSCLSRWIVADLLESGQLHEVRDVLPLRSRRLYLLRHRDKFVSPSLAGFWRHLSAVQTLS
jgi:DNA-binding transcriptional LysR family regulator